MHCQNLLQFLSVLLMWLIKPNKNIHTNNTPFVNANSVGPIVKKYPQKPYLLISFLSTKSASIRKQTNGVRHFKSSLCGIAHSQSIRLIASVSTIPSGLKFKAVFVIKFSAKHLLQTKKTAYKPPIWKMFLKWFQYCCFPSRKTSVDSWFHGHFQLHEHGPEEIYDKKT